MRAAAGKRFHGKAFTLQAAARPIAADPAGREEAEVAPPSGPPQYGFTVTKKVGKAVVRNRIRRRLREAVRTLDPLPARAGHDYVMIARIEALKLPFTALQAELLRALDKIDAAKMRSHRPPGKARRPDKAPENPRQGGQTI